MLNRFVHFIKQTLLCILLIVLLALVVICGVLGWQGSQLFQNASAARPVSVLYDEISARPDFTAYRELPTLYVNAVLSVEDERFWQHSGIDPLSIARALAADIRTRSFAEGGSTLTQQLAKNEYFTQEKRISRKFAEGFAALSIEKRYSKEQIFEMYANTIYFGSGYYGIAQAAQGYFGKTPAELSDAECVMLAGLPNAPSAYSPDTSPELAYKRTQAVLRRMVKCRVLTQEQADAITAETAAQLQIQSAA